ncbi:hypothetical protein TNCV_5039931 [Trichonephila clavipes]|nr:hypothetical protein TNCV_5039931 [Trichonephila clavipes]
MSSQFPKDVKQDCPTGGPPVRSQSQGKKQEEQKEKLRIEEQKEKLRIEEREEKLRIEQLRLDEQKRKDKFQLEKLRIQTQSKLDADTSKESDTLNFSSKKFQSLYIVSI